MLIKTKSNLKDSNGIAISMILLLIAAAIIAFAITSFVFRSYRVDGQSMDNTLQNNNMLIVWKVPRTWASITGHQYVPKRGSIIVFNEGNLVSCGQFGTKQLIKRVIGLPGERVTVQNGHYEVYNLSHPNGFNPDTNGGYGKNNFAPTYGNVNVTLSSNQIFVSGDNRPESCDSRIFGPINTNQVIGQLVLRFYPLNEMNFF